MLLERFENPAALAATWRPGRNRSRAFVVMGGFELSGKNPLDDSLEPFSFWLPAACVVHASRPQWLVIRPTD